MSYFNIIESVYYKRDYIYVNINNGLKSQKITFRNQVILDHSKLKHALNIE